MGKDEQWIYEELKKQKIENIEDVIIATLNDKGNFAAFLKKEDGEKRTILS
jgi:uncharacterized membrane protein YcaP (DUF421 family)